MPTPEISRQVNERLEELYRRHLLSGEDSVASYYESGRGYHGPELAAEERDRFSICLATIDGEVYQAGEHQLPFALQSISKVFVTASLWRTAGGTTSYSGSGWSRAATHSTLSSSTSGTTGRITL